MSKLQTADFACHTNDHVYSLHYESFAKTRDQDALEMGLVKGHVLWKMYFSMLAKCTQGTSKSTILPPDGLLIFYQYGGLNPAKLDAIELSPPSSFFL